MVFSSHASPDTDPKVTPVPAPEPTHPIGPQAIKFTGSGREYFRIWVVNLCLTLATLGIYSAWAKVRRLQYFDRNTQLDGACLNFHGSPTTILKGRLLALVMLVAYHFAFGFSKLFGAIVVVLLFISLPWLLRSALRFRLRNTSYRGIRFNFSGDLGDAYRCFTPLLAIFLLPAAAAALAPSQHVLIGLFIAILYLAWPVIHALIKRYQQRHIVYGDLASTYHGTLYSLVKPYCLTLLTAVGFTAVLLVAVGLMTVVLTAIAGKEHLNWGIGAGFLLGLLYVYGIFLIAGPFLQVRVWNIIWNNTNFPGFTVHSDLETWPFLRLQLVNLTLTLLSLGLYRPFAVIKTYQYRLANMRVGGTEFGSIAQSEQNLQIAASGDSSADLFGIDLSF
jgi:uncharacterized membrane protein YjgN (DUF898 family)